MEGFEEDSFPEASGSQRLFPDPSGASGWGPLHRAIIVLVMGFLILSVSLPPPCVNSSADNPCRTLNFDHSWLFHDRKTHHCPAAHTHTHTHTSGLHSGNWFWFLEDLHMSTPVQLEPVMERSYDGVGRCKCSFWFAVAHDILGTFLMLVGVFGGLVVHDLFIYGGGIVIFLSLIWWVFWYSGNIDELEDDVGMIKLKNRGLGRAVRQMSDRFSSRIRNSFRRNRPSNTEFISSPSPTCIINAGTSNDWLIDFSESTIKLISNDFLFVSAGPQQSDSKRQHLLERLLDAVKQ
ncbi:hypothetical protein F7725_013995, partial [Dissostichus mawsoni]